MAIKPETKHSLALICLAFLSIGFLMQYYNQGESQIESPTGRVISATKAAQDPQNIRVLINPKNSKARLELISNPSVDVRHEFGNSFSAQMPRDKVNTIGALATVTEVPSYQLAFRKDFGPRGTGVCGNLLCEGSESNTCPKDCGTTPFVRTCSPTNQRPYSITQMNTGKMDLGNNVKAAIIDTGALSHPDFSSNIILCADTTQRGITKGCADDSTMGHGTHVAGLIGAEGGPDGQGMIGSAPAAKLLIIKACDRNGICYADDISEAISYAAKNRANIVSMSFGSDVDSSLIHNAIAKYPNILFVASAGNNGPGPDTILYPAANPAVAAAAAHDIDMVGALFSSRGITDSNDASIGAREIEFSAGGVGIESTNNDGCYSGLSGTSFSAPVIAGAAAAVWDISDGTLDGKGNPESTRKYLRGISKDVIAANGEGATSGYDVMSGYGMPVLQ